MTCVQFCSRVPSLAGAPSDSFPHAVPLYLVPQQDIPCHPAPLGLRDSSLRRDVSIDPKIELQHRLLFVYNLYVLRPHTKVASVCLDLSQMLCMNAALKSVGMYEYDCRRTALPLPSINLSQGLCHAKVT